MKRLTKYKPTPNSMFPYKLIDDGSNTELDAIHKLGKLEDIEEELGCPIEVVIKALKEGIYQKGNYRTKFPSIAYNDFTNKFYFAIGTYCNVENYGKTWWLKENKEE